MCAESRQRRAVRAGGSFPEGSRHGPVVTVERTHPLQWLWEPLEGDPGFILSPMFGGKAVYLDGRLVLFFISKDEPWRGMLVCTDRCHHEALRRDFPVLAPHEVLPKWLCIPEKADCFESVAAQIVELASRRDPRIGVLAKPKKPAPGPRNTPSKR